MPDARPKTETGGSVKLSKRILLTTLSAVVIFALGFISGAFYVMPEPGVDLFTTADCSEFESPLDCIAAEEPSLFIAAEPSAEQCSAITQIVDLMTQCQNSVIEGYGQEHACNDGNTWVPGNLEHLEPQLQMMQKLREQSCAINAGEKDLTL